MNFNRFWIDVCDQRMSVTETGPFKSMAQRVQVHRYIMIDTLLVQCHVTTVIVINENGFGELSIYLILGAFLSHLCIWLVSLPSHSFTHSFIRSFVLSFFWSIDRSSWRCIQFTLPLFLSKVRADQNHRSRILVIRMVISLFLFGSQCARKYACLITPSATANIHRANLQFYCQSKSPRSEENAIYYSKYLTI